MTTKTDLTENRDFSGGNGRPRFIPLDSSIRIDELLDSDAMSTEEYEKILAYEKVFGRRRHFTSAIDVFSKSDYEWRMEMSGYCQRCGKLFRIPWKKRYGLCPECDDAIFYTLGKRKTPWKMEVVGNKIDDRDVLQLR